MDREGVEVRERVDGRVVAAADDPGRHGKDRAVLPALPRFGQAKGEDEDVELGDERRKAARCLSLSARTSS